MCYNNLQTYSQKFGPRANEIVCLYTHYYTLYSRNLNQRESIGHYFGSRIIFVYPFDPTCYPGMMPPCSPKSESFRSVFKFLNSEKDKRDCDIPLNKTLGLSEEPISVTSIHCLTVARSHCDSDRDAGEEWRHEGHERSSDCETQKRIKALFRTEHPRASVCS